MCQSWSKREYKSAISNICYVSDQYPWCNTEGGVGFCDIPECSYIDYGKVRNYPQYCHNKNKFSV